MTVRAPIRMVAALAALVLTGGTTACGGGESSDGAARQVVKVGGLFDLSGPTADIGTPYADGIKGFVKYWNETGEGPRIDLTSEDYAYDPGVAQELYVRLKSEGVVAMQGWGTGDAEALTDEVTADRVAFMSASAAETLTKPSATPFNFVAATSYSDQMRIALRWISEQAGGSEVASFHQASPFGRSPQQAGARMAEQLRLGFTAYAMPAKPEHYIRHLRRARSQGTKFVVIQNTSIPAARLAKRIADLRLDVTIVCLNWCADELFIELAGDAADGAVGVQPFAPVSAKADGLAAPRTFLSKRGRALDQEGLRYVQGWYTMAVMAQAIRVAAGKGTVTGNSIKHALEQMGPFDSGGVTATVDFTPTSHAGTKESKLYVVKNEQWAQLTELRKVS